MKLSKFIQLMSWLIIIKIISFFMLLRLCLKYDVKMPKIKIVRFADKNILGDYCNGIIHINFYAKSFDSLFQTVRHEFRHLWQAKYFSEDLKWWNTIHSDIYSIEQFYWLSPIEIDARRFAKSKGKKDDTLIFELAPHDILTKKLEQGELLNYLIEISSFLDEQDDWA